MDWLRLWHDMPTDPKWRVIAARSGEPIPSVISVYIFLLTNASANADERGRTRNWDNDDVAAALGIGHDSVEAIVSAMQGKVLDGNDLTGWEKRQPKREDGSAERAKNWRERKRTQANASERPDKKRLDKNKNPSGGKGLSLVPSDWNSVIDSATEATGKSIHGRHPKPRRDVGEKSVAKFLLAILKRKDLYLESKVKEAVAYLAALDARHARLCTSLQWTKDGGEFAKGLNNWIGSPKEFFEQEPTEAARGQPIRVYVPLPPPKSLDQEFPR